MPTTTSSRPLPDGVRREASRERTTSWLSWALLPPIAWGALAFGAPYPWAYAPLIVICAALGLLAWFRRPTRAHGALRALTAALVVVVVAIAAQLVPLPATFITRLSPATDRILRQFSVQYAVAAEAHLGAAAHPLSIDPTATRLALVLFIAFALLLVGSAPALTRRDLRRLAQGITVLGAVMALAAIVQAAASPTAIYGFWLPREGGQPFGPFVNRNHFAGWMLMAIPVALGQFCPTVSRGMKGVRPAWRDRLLWFASPEANHAALIAAAIAVMSLSLVMSLSRSGILGFVLALAIAGWFVRRRETVASRRALVLAYIVLVVLVAISWTGTARIAGRFTAPDTLTLDGRLATWRDAAHIVELFPLVGTGLNTYGSAALFYQTIDLARYYNAAHNDYLQLAAEGGLLLGLPILLLVGVFVRDVRCSFAGLRPESRSYWIKLGAVTGLLAIALQESVDFSLQMPGNAVLFAVLCAIALSVPVSEPSVQAARHPVVMRDDDRVG
jgi:O-antigen ligase